MAQTENWDHGLEKLLAWQKAMSLAVMICKKAIPVLPTEEKYALADQLRRSAQSIPANIAEGHGRYYFQEGVRYCYLARGSLEETRSHLFFACKMGYLSEAAFQAWNKDIEELRRILNGYIAFLKRTKRGAEEKEFLATIRETSEVYELESIDQDDLFTS